MSGADESSAELVRAYEVAHAAGDVDGMASAALALTGARMFGTLPGRLPAFLHEAYSLATGRQRAVLAVAIARAWSYGGDAARAAEFAAEARGYAESHRDPVLLASALDAQLLVHWGPDDIDERLRITLRLEDAVAHVTDVEARMSAHLWRLTTALECLDITTARRQLRALEELSEETGSPRVQLFAESRHAVFALLRGNIAEAGTAMERAVSAGTEAGEPDTFAIERALSAAIARHLGDRSALTREAKLFESFGEREGVMSILAQAAVLWLEAGEPGRARRLLLRLVGADFSSVERDVDWLLTMTSLTLIATANGIEDLLESAVTLLAPYSGRAVVDAGAVGFAGVVDDYLARAYRALGRDADAEPHRVAATAAYERLGADWWLNREPTSEGSRGRPVLHLRPGSDGVWWVGRAGAVAALRDMKGLHYLRMLLQRPGAEVSALDLVAALAGHPAASFAEPDSGELLDRRAMTEYRNRLTDIDAELDEARSWSDSGRVDVLSEEREALLDQLRSASGLGGRARVAGGTTERARVAVRKAISLAIARIDGVDASVGRLLRDTVRTGSSCRYDPDPDRPTEWVLAG